MEEQVPIFKQLSRPNGKEESPKDTTRTKPRLQSFPSRWPYSLAGHAPVKAISEAIWRPEGSHPHFGEALEVSLSGSVVQARQDQAGPH